MIEACEEGTRENSLQELRAVGVFGKDALFSESIDEYGKAIQRNLQAQRDLHPDLVGKSASQLIETAFKFGALGAKVNGAGGDGGTVTILSNSDPVTQREMVKAITQQDPTITTIPTRINLTGVRRWSLTP